MSEFNEIEDTRNFKEEVSGLLSQLTKGFNSFVKSQSDLNLKIENKIDRLQERESIYIKCIDELSNRIDKLEAQNTKQLKINSLLTEIVEKQNELINPTYKEFESVKKFNAKIDMIKAPATERLTRALYRVKS